MDDAFAALQQRYWSRSELAGRRGAFHPVVSAYVTARLEWLRRTVPLEAGTRVLDIGSGEGRFEAHFDRRCDVVAADFSQAQLIRNPVAKRVQGDAQQLHFKDGAFDLVFAHAVLHHLVDPAGAVREMARVSRRWVVLCEPNRLNPLMLVYHALLPAERGLLRQSKARVTRWIRRAGLRIIAGRTAGLVSANWTPAWLVPALRPLEGAWPLGITHMWVARKG